MNTDEIEKKLDKIANYLGVIAGVKTAKEALLYEKIDEFNEKLRKRFLTVATADAYIEIQDKYSEMIAQEFEKNRDEILGFDASDFEKKIGEKHEKI